MTCLSSFPRFRFRFRYLTLRWILIFQRWRELPSALAVTPLMISAIIWCIYPEIRLPKPIHHLWNGEQQQRWDRRMRKEREEREPENLANDKQRIQSSWPSKETAFSKKMVVVVVSFSPWFCFVMNSVTFPSIFPLAKIGTLNQKINKLNEHDKKREGD